MIGNSTKIIINKYIYTNKLFEMDNSETVDKNFNQNINTVSILKSEDSINDLLSNIRSKQQLTSSQSELLVSHLITMNDEDKLKKRNIIPKLEISDKIHIDSSEQKSILSFRANNSKVDKCNTIITQLYDKMKDYYKKESITPLELLNLKFYIFSTEPKNIKFYDKEPTIIFSERHQLALFKEDNILYCKLYRLNKLAIVDYEIKSYNRFIETINLLPERNNYGNYLEDSESDYFKCEDINKGEEILAAWDKERLFNHITSNGYTIKENLVNKWPKTKNSELIEKIKPKELLDKFWKITITENLSNEEYLSKLENENMELLISSIIFLLKEVTNNEQINHLRTILLNFYKKLIIIDPNNEELHYECAKYATYLELYIEAWYYIHKCTISLYSKKVDIIWLKQLKICYLSYVLNKSRRNDVATSKNYIDIGHFTKTINELEDAKDLSNTLEVVEHFLEGLIRLYYYDENLVRDEINKWSSDIIFILSCSSYCRSSIEQNNEKIFLTMTEICLNLLIGESDIFSKDCLIQISKLDIPYYAEINESSKNIIITRIDILFILAKISIMIPDNELSENLYLKTFQLLCQIENFVPIKDYYSKYENNVIEYIIKKSIDNTITIKLSDLMNLSEILIEREHFTDIYLLILTYLLDKQLCILSYKFMTKSIKLIPDINDSEQKELMDKIKYTYLETQIYKKNLSDALLKVIDNICNNEENDFFINNWLNECFILNNTQYILINKSKILLKAFRAKYLFDDFKDLEKNDFTCKLYEFFGILSPEILWVPDKFVDPVNFIKSPIENTLELRKSNGDIIDDKMIKSIKKMILLGKSIDDIAFFYNIPITTINKILRDQ